MSIRKLLATGALVAALMIPTAALAQVSVEAVGPNGSPTTCNGRAVTIYATAGQMTRGTNGPDVIGGSSGADRIEAKGGNDVICGWGGNDQIHAGAGNDWVNAGVGNDRVWGSTGNDVLLGSFGDDNEDGGYGHDYCGDELGDNVLDNCEEGTPDPGCDDDDAARAQHRDDDCDDD